MPFEPPFQDYVSIGTHNKSIGGFIPVTKTCLLVKLLEKGDILAYFSKAKQDYYQEDVR
jgi:hypothetical protein